MRKRAHNDARTAAELDIEFTDKGYDGLAATQQRILRQAMESMVMRSVYATEYAAMSNDEKKAFLEKKIKTNKFAAEVRREIAEITSETPKATDAISQKQDILALKTVEQGVKDSDLTDVQRRLTTIETRLREFERPAVGAAGIQAREIDRLKAVLPTLETEVQTYTQEVANRQYRLSQLEDERRASLQRNATTRPTTEIDTDIGNVRRELQNNTTELNRRVAEINKLPQLEQQEQELEGQRADVAKEKSEKEIAKGKADIELAAARREYQNAVSAATAQDTALAARLDGVFSEASMEVLNETTLRLAEKYDEALTKAKEAAVNADQKALYDTMEHRWVRMVPGRRFGKSQPRRVMHEAAINADINTLLTQGPEQYVREMLSVTENPTTHNSYTADEINALIANKDYMEKMVPAAAVQLLARKEMIGGLERADLYTITHSQWGEGLITEASKTNAVFRTEAERLMGAGALDEPGFMERIRREAQRNPSLVAALLAALVGAGGLVLGGAVLGVGGAAASGAAAFAKGSYSSGNKMYG